MHHLKEFDKQTSLKLKYKDNAYMLWILGLYIDESDLDALASRSLTDGGNDKCIDFMEIDKSGQKIVIAQGYFTQKASDKAPSSKASNINTAIAWLKHGNIDSKTINEKVRTRIIECREAIKSEEIEQIDILYIHNLPESLNSEEELATCQISACSQFQNEEIAVTCREIGLREAEYLYLERSSQILIKEDIHINGKKLGEHSTVDWSAYLYTVKGTWLRNLFKMHEDKLFSANYRGFLGINKRKKINSSIKSTAEKQGSDFWVFNNGITLLTSGVKRIAGKTYLQGVSIINGAQTTSSLGSIDENHKLSDVNVMCRVVVCKNSEKIDQIVKFNNTQNRITTWNQYANDEIQNLLRHQFVGLGLNYNVKRGFDASDAEIGIEKSAQPALSFNGFYVDANRGRNSIFDRPEIYKKAFSDRSARHILLAYCFYKSIDGVRNKIQKNSNRKESEDIQLGLFNFLSFKNFLLACIGTSLEQFVEKKCTPSQAQINKNIHKPDIDLISEKLEKVTRHVLRFVSSDISDKFKLDRVGINSYLKNDESVKELKNRLNTFLESVLDGKGDSDIAKLIEVIS
jgi:hypothetical protein